MEYPNFYESISEAQIRLRNTVVLYDGKPYYIPAITDHMKDGIFRVYLTPLVDDRGKRPQLPDQIDHHSAGSTSLGLYLDKWMEEHPNRLLRKHANSPLFNKYRPFRLGMCAFGSAVFYLERQPNRVTQQGLLRSMIFETRVDCGASSVTRKQATINIFSQNFIDCVQGDYNTPEECLSVMLDVDNYDYEAAAFHRDFALVQGPCEMLFLGYKDDIIGYMPNRNFSMLRLGKDFRHCREVVEELTLFNAVV